MQRSTEQEISDQLHELTLASELTTIEIQNKNVEEEKINRNIIEKKNKLNKVNNEIQEIRVKQERTRNVRNVPVLE